MPRKIAVSHDYIIRVTSPYEHVVEKATGHLAFSLHWSRVFQYVNRTEQNLIVGRGVWNDMESTLNNFLVYYKSCTFTVTVDDNEPVEFSKKVPQDS